MDCNRCIVNKDCPLVVVPGTQLCIDVRRAFEKNAQQNSIIEPVTDTQPRNLSVSLLSKNSL